MVILIFFDAFVIDFLHFEQMLGHTVEIVAEGHCANYGESHGNEADPD